MNYITSFYERYHKPPTLGRLQFADAMNIIEKNPYDRALAWLKRRGKELKITTSWNEIDDAAHARAFTVSTVMKADVLQEVYDQIEKARTDGVPFGEFKKTAFTEGGLISRMQESGWTGQGASRLKVIYDTNLTIAHSKAQFEQFGLLKKERPYLKYKQLQRANKRHSHAMYHDKVFRVDDPIWKDIAPPRGFGCGCTVIALRESDVIHDGKEFEKPTDNQINPFKVYKPETDKYVSGIQNKLKDILNDNS